MSTDRGKVPVSVIVPIRNEAENLPRCLDSIQWADEVIVVDSQSTDDSARIAEQHGARVEQFRFNGTWPKKKNWALEHLPSDYHPLVTTALDTYRRNTPHSFDPAALHAFADYIFNLIQPDL